MHVLGVDLDALQAQFENAKPGRTLILDGDGPCYVAAATAKRLDTAVRRFQSAVLQRMFMAGAEDCRIHLTAHNSDKHGRFRVKATQPYQGNRSGKAKPALLEPLREAVADRSNWLDEYEVLLHRELEADDGMMQDAYLRKENGVISSEDKDLRMTPYLYYDLGRGQVCEPQPEGYVEVKFTEGGQAKLVGQGPMFFWGQMLCGDQADHIRGVQLLEGKKCGVQGAYGILRSVRTCNEAANIVIDAYRAIGQNVLAEGWLLWLTRWHKDNVVEYMRSLELTSENRGYVEDCLTRDWVAPREVNDHPA